MKKIKILLLLLAFLPAITALSQKKIYDNVVEFELRGSLQITNNKQVVGYGFFYMIDKMKKANLYRLSILDENLKEIGSNEFEGPKDLYLARAVYESDRLFLAFNDEDKKEGYEKFVKVYDMKGKETGLVAYEPEKVKSGMYGKAIAASMGSIYEGIDNVEGKGIVSVYQSKAKTGGVDVQMIGSNGKLKWEKNITAEKGDRADLYLLGTTANTILLFKMERGSATKRDADIFLVGLSADNGKELFKKPLDINGISYDPMMLKKGNDGKLRLVSTMQSENDKFATAKPIGISVAELNDQTGEIKIVKDFSYENDLSNVLDMKNASKSEDGYIKAHDILLMEDGGMVLVGEFFRRTVSAFGMAAKILSKGGGPAASQATIEDMFLLRIDNSFKAKALEKIEKDKERVPLPADGLSIGLIARLLTYDGDFGYMYTDEGMDGKQQTILARGSFGEEKYGTVAITVDPKKGYSTKRFNLTKEKNTIYRIYRGKPGYVMVIKYNSKEKTLTTDLEKIN